MSECPFRYQGQYFDEETGLAYNRFRYYDAGAGSFISQDPIRLVGGNNLYGYVHDTNSWLDPEGLSKLGDNLTLAKQGIPDVSATWQAHHVIPQATWNKSQGFFDTVGFGGKHSAANRIFLPSNAKDASKFGYSVYHSGSHGDYTEMVQARIKKIEGCYKNNIDTMGEVKAKAQAKAELENLQKRLKTALGRKGGGAKRLH